MTKLNVPEAIQPQPAAPPEANTELRTYMQKAARASVELSTIITPAIEARQLDSGQALIAVLLYAANFARRYGATAADFTASAEQAFSDAEELFATDTASVLRAARALLKQHAWIQGEMAVKWVKDATAPNGKRLVPCHVDDDFASRWSLLGAIEKAADAKSNRERARAAVVRAIIEAGWPAKLGSLDITVINEYNDHGWAPPLPKLVLPEAPPAGAPAEAVANYQATIAKMRHDYDTITVPQWPKPAVPGRTYAEIITVLDRAAVIAGG